ncbi:hypothetical protein HP499_02795 [Paenarthrobacter sp. CM16]|nr:hypothetical protein [Paenarthrobacter sp. CM16]
MCSAGGRGQGYGKAFRLTRRQFKAAL